MYLSRLHIDNFRLLKNVDITLERELTLFVGKNNSGKTSVIDVLSFLASDSKKLVIDDYPLTARGELYNAILKYWEDNDLANLKKNIPITKFILTFDYSDDAFGNLGQFVIDLDEKNNIAIIEISFDLVLNIDGTLKNLKNKYDELLQSDNSNDSQNTKCIAQIVRDNFDSIFSMNIASKDPSDQSDYFEEMKRSDLQKLLNMKVIMAERNMDESATENDNPLGQVMKKLFSTELEDVETELKPSMLAIHKIVNEANFNLNKKINSHMDKIVSNMMTFGYPSWEDLKLRASITLSLQKHIVDSTKLAYVANSEWESLPETYNGLGYKNLIKITMELQNYARSVRDDYTKLHLLIIEEPEAHMHPQLQTTFVSFLNDFLKKEVGNNCVQVIITSHSAHVANTIPFKQVRCILRKNSYVIYKSMSDFLAPSDSTQNDKQLEKEKQTRLEFLQKYMKLSYCDLYFCDKAILVEGASERLLLPSMIEKCSKENCFSDTQIPLTNQYCSIIEVGGAYAHKFFDLVDYLEIPTLVITDVDFVDSSNKRCQKKKAKKTSNATIKEWCRKKLKISGKITIEDVFKLEENDDMRTEKFRRLEFQHEEEGFHPRSLEEAIQNVNRKLFAKSERDELDFSEESIKKTDFALSLLIEDKYENYRIPSYIKEGLIWLNRQSRDTFLKESAHDK